MSLKVIFEPKPIESAEGILSANKEYAGDVEFSIQPYLRPAVLDSLLQISGILAKELIQPVVSMERAMTSVMLGVLSRSQALVPIDTGALLISLRQEVI